jgi:hypothetical protein
LQIELASTYLEKYEALSALGIEGERENNYANIEKADQTLTALNYADLTGEGT